MIISFSFRTPSHSLRFTRWFTAFNALKHSVYHTIFKFIIYHGSWIFRYEYLSYRKIIIYSPKLPSKIFCRFIRLWPHECQRLWNFILIIIFAHNSYFLLLDLVTKSWSFWTNWNGQASGHMDKGFLLLAFRPRQLQTVTGDSGCTLVLRETASWKY